MATRSWTRLTRGTSSTASSHASARIVTSRRATAPPAMPCWRISRWPPRRGSIGMPKPSASPITKRPMNCLITNIGSRGRTCNLVCPAEVGDDGSLDFEGVDRACLAVEDLASGSHQDCIGNGTGPFLVEGLGKLVAVVDAQDGIGCCDVVFLEQPQGVFFLGEVIQADGDELKVSPAIHPVHGDQFGQLSD